VGDHARGFPATREHRFRGGGAARGELGSKADAPGVPGDPAVDAGGRRGGGEAARDGLAVETAEHRRRGVRGAVRSVVR